MAQKSPKTVAGKTAPVPGSGAVPGQLRLDDRALADEDDLHVRVLAPEIQCRGNRHMGAVIAPHAIDGDGDGQSPLPLATFFPR